MILVMAIVGDDFEIVLSKQNSKLEQDSNRGIKVRKIVSEGYDYDYYDYDHNYCDYNYDLSK